MKLRKISDITPTLPFTEFDFLQHYRDSFAKGELGRIRVQLPLKELAAELHQYEKSGKQQIIICTDEQNVITGLDIETSLSITKMNLGVCKRMEHLQCMNQRKRINWTAEIPSCFSKDSLRCRCPRSNFEK